MSSNIVINGIRYESQGGSISIHGGVVIIDGVVQGGDKLSGIVKIELTGDLANLTTDASVTMTGNISGDLEAGGSVTIAGDVAGNIEAGGSVKCGNVNKNVSAGGSVDAVLVGGSISAGGSVRHSGGPRYGAI